MSIERININSLPKALGPYVHAVKVDDKFIYTSGQLGIDKNGKLKEGIKDQTRQVLLNLKLLIESLNSSLNNTIKALCLLNDINNFDAFNEVYAEFFNDNKPARSCFEVAKLPKNALIEIELIVLK